MSVRDENILLDRIQELLCERAVGTAPPSLAQVEDTLTDGYARVLALESERWRLERSVSEAAKQLGKGDATRPAERIASLTRAIARADARLAKLRPALVELRQAATELRAASRPAA
jgi:uncharacterized protein involved in exopolysaccharide biosynthesis